jgi:hypothetical protein
MERNTLIYTTILPKANTNGIMNGYTTTKKKIKTVKKIIYTQKHLMVSTT